jgi:hypothetical protein
MTITYVQEAKVDKPARCYKVDVIFSLHCFTRGIKDGEQPDPALCYSDDRETRVFDFLRYECFAQRTDQDAEMKKAPRKRAFLQIVLIGPLGHPHTWVETGFPVGSAPQPAGRSVHTPTT